MTWTPLISFFVFIVILAIGNEVSIKSKALLPLVLVSAVLHLLGYWTGIIPLDSVANTGLPAMLGAFGTAMMVTNLGTMMDLNQLLGEWKTVLISLVGILGVAVGTFTVSTWIFGREYALAAAAPIAGGNVATLVISEACLAAGREDLGGFIALVTTLQFLVGVPLAAFLLKTQISSMQKKGLFLSEEKLHEGEKKLPHINRHVLWKKMPEWWIRPYPMLARLALVAVVSNLVSGPTGIPVTICYLVLGILACQFGFLELKTLQEGGYYPFFMILQLSNIPRLLAAVTLDSFLGTLVSVFGILFLGAGFLAVFGLLAGLVLKIPARMSMAISLCAMMGYPYTLLLTEEAVATMDGSETEQEIAKGYALPKMLVGGFTSVTLASVAFAGIIAPILFT